MANILVVYHSLGGNTAKMAEAVAEGARTAPDTEATVKTGLEATVDDLLACDGIALGSPDYFSYIAGGLKDFFDRTYYPSQGKTDGKPAVIFASAGGPPDTVLRILDQAIGWFKLSRAAEAVGCSGAPSEEALSLCREAGRKLAEAAQK